MEPRLLLSGTLLDLDTAAPNLAFDSQGTIEYDAAGQALSIDATPLSFQLADGTLPLLIFAPRDLQLDVRVDNSGALLGGVPGDDLVVTGAADLDGDYVADVSGVLLTAEVLEFGCLDVGGTDKYDFRFELTGGLLEPFYAGGDLAVVVTSENSSFQGSFDEDFSGGAKGTISSTGLQVLPASLGDYVWHDMYHGPGHLVDGIQDAGEPGIGGVVVNLLDAEGNLLDQTTTDPTGLYEFTGLAADEYLVEVDAGNFAVGAPLEDYYATLPDAAGNTLDATDSDGAIDTHRSGPVVLESGEHDPTIDFGFFTTGIDLVKEAPDEVTAGDEIVYTFTVENTGDVVLHGGAHVYDPLLNPAGNHEIWGGVLQPGEVYTFTRSYQTTAGIPSIDFDTDAFGAALSAGTVADTEWAAYGVHVTTHSPVHHPAMIFDSADPTGGDWDLGTPNEDFGGPGRGYGGEAGRTGENDQALGNILIISEDADSDDPDDSAAGGTLIFTFDNAVNVEAVGVLDIDCGESGGWIRAFDESGDLISATPIEKLGDNSAQTVDVDAEGVTRLEVHLVSSGAVTDLVFGGGECGTTIVNEAWAIGCPIGPYGGLPNVQDDASAETDVVCEPPPAPAALGDLVWLDENANGVQDAGEAGVAGVDVTLFGAGEDGLAGTADDVELATQETDADGEYLFDALAPGAYFVEFQTPAGYELTSADEGANDALDSDANEATGRTAAVVLAAGETNRTVDAGLVAQTGGEGCTPGFWKQCHHYKYWEGYSPSDKFRDVFGVPASRCLTLAEALKLGGGGENALARHAVAALLNAAHSDIDYAFTEQEVVAMVQQAWATGAYEQAKDALAEQNEMGGCDDIKDDRCGARKRGKWWKKHSDDDDRGHRHKRHSWRKRGKGDDDGHGKKRHASWKRGDDRDDDGRRSKCVDVLSIARILKRRFC